MSNSEATEAGFLAALEIDSDDKATLGAYADWLSEQGREDEALAMRRRFNYRREARNLQLWPDGQSVTFSGDEQGPDLEVQEKATSLWRKATDEERRGIRINTLAQMYAERDIYCCDSGLVTDALRLGYEHSGEFFQEWTMENVRNLSANPDDWSIQECHEWLDENGEDMPDPNPWTMERSELVELLEGASIECRDDEPDSVLRAAVRVNMDDENIDGLDAWREAVRDHASEHEAEIYEWWRVSRWLAGQLEAIGECVLDNNYGEWWGRRCTGQQFIMDGVLQRVAQRFVD